MVENLPKPMIIEEFIRTATMFYIDVNLEAEFDKKIKDIASDTIEGVKQILQITRKDGLAEYIQNHENSLEKIISLLGISKERFKRVITMLRVERRHRVTSEWDIKKIRSQMLTDSQFMDSICEMLISGSTNIKYQKLIPSFILENFIINAGALGRLSNPNEVRRLAKEQVEGEYNNKIGDSYFRSAQEIIEGICNQKGLTYAIKKNVPILGRPVGISIPNELSPRILIDITYCITTSSAQSDYAKDTETAATEIRSRNQVKPERKKIFYINVVDGVGWVARQSDLNRIARCSDYLLNLKSLGTIGDIVNYYIALEE